MPDFFLKQNRYWLAPVFSLRLLNEYAFAQTCHTPRRETKIGRYLLSPSSCEELSWGFKFTPSCSISSEPNVETLLKQACHCCSAFYSEEIWVLYLNGETFPVLNDGWKEVFLDSLFLRSESNSDVKNISVIMCNWSYNVPSFSINYLYVWAVFFLVHP